MIDRVTKMTTQNSLSLKIQERNEVTDFGNLDDFCTLLIRVDEKFVSLRKKVHRVLSNDLDEESYDVFVNSILIDCRALFIENKRYSSNCTIQNFYKATNHPEYADEINTYFDRKTADGLNLREIIKTWVDKHLVHFDFVYREKEEDHLNSIRGLLNRQTIDNLFTNILLIARQYEEYKLYLRQKADSVIQAMTGEPNSPESDG